MDKKLLPVEDRREPFKDLNCLKMNIWLMHPWSKCSCLIHGMGKEHVICCAPVLVEVDKELPSRAGAYLLIPLLFDIPCTNYLDTGLGISAKTCTVTAGCFGDEEQVGAYTSIPIKASHIIVSECDTFLFFLVIACFSLMPCQSVGWWRGQPS